MSEISPIGAGGRRPILVVVAHADDLALFLGGTISRWADAGWAVIAARVTDDRWDSVGLTEAQAIRANHAGLRDAAAILGISEIVELGYPTDTLGDASEIALRERIVRLIRTYQPYALVTFDPYAMYGEDNQDHRLVAKATDEAFWTSQFDLHHPEHFAEGLAPHGCFERWYFGRRVIEVTDVIDISAVIDRKVNAALCHKAMLANMINQLRLQATTGGWAVPDIEGALADGDLRPVMEPALRSRAQAAGRPYGVEMAEEFRVVRFGGAMDYLHARGRRIKRVDG